MQVDPRIYELKANHMGSQRIPLKLNGPKSEPVEAVVVVTLLSYKGKALGYVYGSPLTDGVTRLGRTGMVVALDGAPLVDVPRSYVLAGKEKYLTWILRQYEKRGRLEGQSVSFQAIP